MIDGIIVKGVGGLYTVQTEDAAYECSARGIFRNRNVTPLIGDYVEINVIDRDQKTASIDAIKKRRSEMLRPRVANVDQAAVILAAAHPALNLNLLDRFILLAEHENLEVVICLNKIDLDESNEIRSTVEMYEKIGYPVLLMSASRQLGIDALKRHLQKKVTVFAGPSGVGKSSIINMLVPGAHMETGGLSKKIARGKHTTRHAELMTVCEDSYVVDTPGFTSLQLAHIDPERLAALFKEFRPFLDGCRFRDCRHLKEIDCRVKENVGLVVSQQRYDRYCEVYSEIDHERY